MGLGTDILNNMKIDKDSSNFLLSVVAVLILLGAGYYLLNVIPSTPRSIPGGVSDLGPSSPNDPAFFNPTYKSVSSRALSSKEKTVNYLYTDSPCGTLMTQFSQMGYVRVGRGPVYDLALNQCKIVDSSYVPNDFSFRTYACENVLVNDEIQGNATFAFQCSPASENTKCSEARIKGGTPQIDWNCSSI